MKQEYRALYKHQNFMKLLLANFINRMGDSIDMIAFSWLVYSLTGSAAWSAVILGVNMIPNVILQPIAGAFVEQRKKRDIMIFADLSRGFFTLVILICYIMGVLNPWLLLTITFLNNVMESFRNPASSAFLPSILPADSYEYGISLSQSSSRICEVIGIALAGVLISGIGVEGAVFIDFVTFLISALIIFSIRTKEAGSLEKGKQSTLMVMKEGFAYLKEMPILCIICICAALINVLLVPYNSFETPYIRSVLHLGADVLSLSNILLTIGMGIGSLCYPLLHQHLSNRWLLIITGCMAGWYYLALYGISLLSGRQVIVVSLCIASFLFGCGIAVLINLISVSLMKNTKVEYLARVSAIFNSISTFAMPATSFLLGAICTRMEVVQIFMGFALFTFAVFIGMIFIKRLKQL